MPHPATANHQEREREDVQGNARGNARTNNKTVLRLLEQCPERSGCLPMMNSNSGMRSTISWPLDPRRPPGRSATVPPPRLRRESDGSEFSACAKVAYGRPACTGRTCLPRTARRAESHRPQQLIHHRGFATPNNQIPAQARGAYPASPGRRPQAGRRSPLPPVQLLRDQQMF